MIISSSDARNIIVVHTLRMLPSKQATASCNDRNRKLHSTCAFRRMPCYACTFDQPRPARHLGAASVATGGVRLLMGLGGIAPSRGEGLTLGTHARGRLIRLQLGLLIRRPAVSSALSSRFCSAHLTKPICTLGRPTAVEACLTTRTQQVHRDMSFPPKETTLSCRCPSDTWMWPQARASGVELMVLPFLKLLLMTSVRASRSTTSAKYLLRR